MLFSLHAIRHLVLFATFVLMCFSADATDSVASVSLKQSRDLSGETLGLRYLRDTRQTLTIGELRKLPEGQFSVVRQRDVNQRFQRGDYWLKTSVHNASKASMTWVLRHPMPVTDYVDYWIFTNGALVTHATGGDRTLMSDR
ncbi:7TMR-DISMED2 domain-containing protein [Massilia pseudoviolaceinigra]|uniref:7TMR-DISMED2 domain-containing protein n=1 Tax=Massilia pseudoviolaceinigra TaxID=3057165 RepID=UPI0027967FF5|nr:7TM-DISM domain-containing protein [Massilia sp. CCM 9206]MDQ1923467.1 7TM-DISM domain-containing protein [Massilia sp. CCM 9206]